MCSVIVYELIGEIELGLLCSSNLNQADGKGSGCCLFRE
jgi:hypothetical protein